MLIRRFAAAAAAAWLLAGCSWFTSFDEQTSRYPGSAGPGEREQFAALPGYLSDENFALEANEEQVTAPPMPMPRAKPIPPVQTARPAKRVVLTLANILKNASFTAMPPLSASIDPANHTLADVLKDHAWRQATSRKLEHLLR
ncbi:MAG: hypothetical protein V3U99_05110 [Alphaproteobacteria bacterium]